MNRYYIGEEFLNKIYPDLNNSEIVNHSSKNSGNKDEKVSKYMNRLEKVTNKLLENNKINLMKKYYYDKYVIKAEDVPEACFKLQEKIALERGNGHVTYDEQTKKQKIEHIISEQKSSLDEWIDYFTSEETSYYPTWFKYYIFQGVMKLGIYDKEKNTYSKRTSSTVHPFVELNREAVAFIYSELIKILGKEKIEDKELEVLLNNGSFIKIYSYVVRKLDSNKDETKSEEGIWKKYNQGSNPKILFNDIHGKGTGWCTAGGIETANMHINGGDFYVYYTKGKDNEYSKPRIAIRTENGKIAEIRGIAEHQNLESNMEKVVKEKLEEFPDKEEYLKKEKDMEMLTYIYTKWENKVELTKEDLRFLYEIDEEIQGFGFKKDPRIEEIKNTRNIKKDISEIFDCKEENISLTEEEALSGNIIYHYGNLDLFYVFSVDNIEFPKNIRGNLNLENLSNIKNLVLPEKIGGYLDLRDLKNFENIKWPNKVGKSLYLDSLSNVRNLVLPEEIGGSLYLIGLNNYNNIKWPNKLKGDLICPLLLNNLQMGKANQYKKSR